MDDTIVFGISAKSEANNIWQIEYRRFILKTIEDNYHFPERTDFLVNFAFMRGLECENKNDLTSYEADLMLSEKLRNWYNTVIDEGLLS